MKYARTVGVVSYGIFIVSALVSHFQHYPIPGFVIHLISLAQSIGFSLFAYSLGRVLLKYFDWTSPSLITRCVVRWGMGMGSLGTIVFLLGWAVPGSLHLKLTFLTIALLAISIITIKDLPRAIKLLPMTPWAFGLGESLLLAFSLFGVLVTFVTCFSPITYYDSLVYHLALPAIYHRLDAIQPVFENLYSFFPANTEMLFLYIFDRFGYQDEIINLMGLTFSVLISIQLYVMARDHSGRKAGLLAAALWWTAPCVALLSVGAYIDIPLAFYTLMVMYLFFDARKTGLGKHYFLTGLFAGFAMSTKLTGAIVFMIVMLFLLWDFKKSKQFSSFMNFSGGALIPISGWFVKNWITIGNPFFPFFYRWFGGNVGWTKETAAGYFRVLTEYDQRSNLFLEILRSPWNLIHHNLHFGGGFDVLGDFGWTYFILLIPLIFIDWTNQRRNFAPVIFASCYFVIWFFTKAVLRFLIPVLPVVVYLTAVMMANIWAQRSVARYFTRVLFLIFLTSNIQMLFFIYQEIQPFSVPFGFESKSDYLRRRLNFYKSYESLNILGGASGNVLVLGEQRTYHLRVPFISSNYFAPSPLSLWCKDALNPERLGQKFRSEGIKYLFINERELARLGGMSQFGFNDIDSKNLQDFLRKSAVPVQSVDGTTIFQIL